MWQSGVRHAGPEGWCVLSCFSLIPIPSLFSRFPLSSLLSPLIFFLSSFVSSLLTGASYDDGYDAESKAIHMFWEVVLKFNDEEKRLFLKFLTGR